MSVFHLGAIIKARREALELSQEDLADGICSVPTLSRIENGERMPTKNHFEMLMQRLGYSVMSLDFFTDERDFLSYELRLRITHEYMAHNYAEAKRLLEELKGVLTEPTRIDEQYLLLEEVLLNEEKYTNEQKLEMCERAFQLTCPKYKKNYIPKVLSYEEIILLNNIAIYYGRQGNYARAITIFKAVKAYYENHVVSVEEALRTEPMILYNLSKYLGLNGQYDECIEVCDLGIRLARKTGRCNSLGKTLFNRGWALLSRNRAGDREAAKVALEQAIAFAEVMDRQHDAQVMREHYNAEFGTDASI